MENVSILGDRYRVSLLNLPKNVDDVYYLNGVLKTGDLPINSLPEGVTLSFRTKNGRGEEPNFRLTVSKVYADGDYFGKIAEAYEDVYESSEENAKLLRTKKQTVEHLYGGELAKENSVIKDGIVVASAVKKDDGLGNVFYKDMQGNIIVKRYSYHDRIPLEVQKKRIFHNNGLKGRLQKFVMKLVNDKNGCERKYIRKLGGLLFK